MPWKGVRGSFPLSLTFSPEGCVFAPIAPAHSAIMVWEGEDKIYQASRPRKLPPISPSLHAGNNFPPLTLVDPCNLTRENGQRSHSSVATSFGPKAPSYLFPGPENKQRDSKCKETFMRGRRIFLTIYRLVGVPERWCVPCPKNGTTGQVGIPVF